MLCFLAQLFPLYIYVWNWWKLIVYLIYFLQQISFLSAFEFLNIARLFWVVQIKFTIFFVKWNILFAMDDWLYIELSNEVYCLPHWSIASDITDFLFKIHILTGWYLTGFLNAISLVVYFAVIIPACWINLSHLLTEIWPIYLTGIWQVYWLKYDRLADWNLTDLYT